MTSCFVTEVKIQKFTLFPSTLRFLLSKWFKNSVNLLKYFFEQIDVNADGTIPYKHFLEMFTKISPPLPASPESRSRLVPGRRRSSAEKALSQSLDPNQPKYVVVNTSKDQSKNALKEMQ